MCPKWSGHSLMLSVLGKHETSVKYIEDIHWFGPKRWATGTGGFQVIGEFKYFLVGNWLQELSIERNVWVIRGCGDQGFITRGSLQVASFRENSW